MDDTREVHVEHVEHVPDDPEEHVVDTAAAAVALAEGAAASAELQAAERVAEVERDADEWKAQTQANLAGLNERLAQLSESVSSFSLLEAERHKHNDVLNERLSAIEARLNPSPSNPNHSAEIAGAEATTEAKLGPAEAEIGGGASLGSPTEAKQESESSPPKRRHRWI